MFNESQVVGKENRFSGFTVEGADKMYVSFNNRIIWARYLNTILELQFNFLLPTKSYVHRQNACPAPSSSEPNIWTHMIFVLKLSCTLFNCYHKHKICSYVYMLLYPHNNMMILYESNLSSNLQPYFNLGHKIENLLRAVYPPFYLYPLYTIMYRAWLRGSQWCRTALLCQSSANSIVRRADPPST